MSRVISFCIVEDSVGLNGDEEPVWLRFVPLRDGDGMPDDWRLAGEVCWSLVSGGLPGMEFSLESSWEGSGIGSGVICYKKRTQIRSWVLQGVLILTKLNSGIHGGEIFSIASCYKPLLLETQVAVVGCAEMGAGSVVVNSPLTLSHLRKLMQ